MTDARSPLWPGVPLALGAAVLFGATTPLSKLLVGAVDPWLLAGILYLGAGVGLALVQAVRPVVGFAGVGVSLVLYMLGLRHLGAARTGAYFSLAPFIGAALAVAIFREPVTVTLLGAGALMALGLWLHLAERHDHDHQHEAMEHDHLHSHDAHHQHDHDSPVSEPHSHWHRHEPMRHRHAHYPDLHHRHDHPDAAP